jgi:hypothetical protein
MTQPTDPCDIADEPVEQQAQGSATAQWLALVESQLTEIRRTVDMQWDRCPRECAIVRRSLDDARVWAREIARDLAQPVVMR